MAEQEKNKNKKLQLLLDDLSSENIDKQLAAVDALRAHGNETIIRNLLDVYKTTGSDELKNEISDLLNTIKSEKTPAVVMKYLADKKYADQKIILLTSAWSSGLDYSPYVAGLVNLAIDGDLMEVFEIQTIIENLETLPSDEVINEGLIVLGNYLAENKNESSPRIDLLMQIGNHLKKLNED
ncbi:MAG: hypothetical protein IPM74_13085 [Crocinitomicaceae bacterium]|nr:hypothetical protein [Crocinitomicaceae bacterium]MBK8926809.1 hypothetical protein [Crocinitomicaceae bacterium]